MQAGSDGRRQPAAVRQRVEQGRRVARHQQCRLLRGAEQHAGLHQEFQVDQAAGALLEIETRRIAAVQLGTHARTHLAHFLAQRCGLARACQGLRAHLLELLQQRRIAGHAAGAHQRLVLPGPGALALVLPVAGQRRHQRALAAVRAQAHVDVVQAAAAGDRAEQRDHLLRQPREPAPALQRPRSGRRFDARRVVVQEHQVQVRADAQFHAAQAAVADDGETAARHLAVRGDQISTRQAQHGHHHRLGQLRELAGAVERGLAPVQRRQSDAETQRLARFVEATQGRLRIVAGGGDCGVAQPLHRRQVRHRAVDAAVEQFVQQQRVRSQPFGEEGTARQHVDQPRQRAGLFVEQGQIAGPAQDRLQQAEYAVQGGIGLRRARRGMQQRRQHTIQARARGIGQGAHAQRLHETAQGLVGAVGVGEAGGAQHLRLAGVRQAAPVVGQCIGRQRALARRQQFGELGGDAIALHLQRCVQRGPVGIAEAERDARAIQRVLRQRVGLRVTQHLQAVLHLAQEAIRLRQRRAILGGDLAGGDQRVQRRQQAAFAQCGFAAAADQLQRLHQELDLANATGAALDVVQAVVARDFGGDRRLHLAQAVQRGVVEIAPVHERAQRLQPFLAGGDVAGHRARLEPGVAFPIAAFALEILVHAGERQRHPAGRAERTQAQIHAVREAVGGGLVEQPHQALSEPREVFLGGQRTRAVGLAALRVGVDQVHVGGEIQFAAAELAQAEHYQPLHAAVGSTHHAMARGELAFQRLQRQRQAVLGQLRAAGQGRIDLVQAQHVAPHQPRRGGRAVATQLRRPCGGLRRIQLRQRQRRRVRLRQVREQ